MNSGYFITATGTDIGKSFVTAGLVRGWRALGQQVHAIKPLISGVPDLGDHGSDSYVIAEALGRRDLTHDALRIHTPFSFAAPLSPDMAAAREGRTLDYDALVDFCREQVNAHLFTLIEGVGGAFVPLTDKLTVADWMKDLDLPILLVTGSYLGSLSHTLSAVEALAARGMAPAHIIISESHPAGPDAPGLEETTASLRDHLDLPTHAVPRHAKAGPVLTDLARAIGLPAFGNDQTSQ